MLLDENWATIEDFATLFQYFWYRDFPLDQAAIGARRSDWTIHTGIVVRNVADLLGYVTRFESGKRKDAVLRSAEGDEIAIEWEWDDVLRWINASGNEVEKLKNHRVWPKGKEGLKYAVLVTYTRTPYIQKVYELIKAKWEEGEGARWPLLLILIDVIDVPKKQVFVGREFMNIQMSVFDKGKPRVDLRLAPAFPWKVPGTRLSINWFKE
ncbi:MAG: hypothetical protein DRI01_04505 [Chloroflexi bacterium]|nr:MAG: hypothetical protein DRI01_04505 [Chloroflexota bacterium]